MKNERENLLDCSDIKILGFGDFAPFLGVYIKTSDSKNSRDYEP
jgi:hypothetical protein